MPYDVMQQIVLDFTGAECPAMQEQGNPHMLQVAAACTALSEVSISMFEAWPALIVLIAGRYCCVDRRQAPSHAGAGRV